LSGEEKLGPASNVIPGCRGTLRDRNFPQLLYSPRIHNLQSNLIPLLNLRWCWGELKTEDVVLKPSRYGLKNSKQLAVKGKGERREREVRRHPP